MENEPAWKRPIPSWVYVALMVWTAVLAIGAAAVVVFTAAGY